MSTQDQTTTNYSNDVDLSLATRCIWDTLGSLPHLSRLVEAIRLAEIEYELKQPDFRTLFAPTNEALEAAPAKVFRNLVRQKDASGLRSVLVRHIANGKQSISDLKGITSVTSVSGELIQIESIDGLISVGGAPIVGPDIICTNGQLHVIGRLIFHELPI